MIRKVFVKQDRKMLLTCRVPYERVTMERGASAGESFALSSLESRSTDGGRSRQGWQMRTGRAGVAGWGRGKRWKKEKQGLPAVHESSSPRRKMASGARISVQATKANPSALLPGSDATACDWMQHPNANARSGRRSKSTLHAILFTVSPHHQRNSAL